MNTERWKYNNHDNKKFSIKQLQYLIETFFQITSMLCSGVSRMAYPRGANRGRGFGAPGQIEEWRPSAEVLDGEMGLDARSDYFFFR